MDAFFDAILSPAGTLGMFMCFFFFFLCKRKHALLAPFEPIDLTHPDVPPCAPRFFAAVARELTPLGFRPLVCARPSTPPSPTTQSYVGVFEHPQTNDWATAMVVIANTRFLRELVYVVEFGSRFADGSTLCTTNSWPTFTPAPSNAIVQRFPAMGDLPLLHRLHRIYATAHERPPIRHAPDGGALDYLLADTRATVEHSVAEGRMRHVDDIRVAYSIRQSLLLLVGALPPGRQIVRRRAVRRARQALRELGLPPNYRMTKHQFLELR